MPIEKLLPAEAVFTPLWWNKNCGITFDRDFFFDPHCRVDRELSMRKYLYERFGDLGLGEKGDIKRPVIGPVHLAAGFITSQLMGCEIRYNENGPPDVLPANMSDKETMCLKIPDLMHAGPFNDLIAMMDMLETEYGYLEGDIDWNGVQNIALDLRGPQLFIDYYENNEIISHLFDVISQTLINTVRYIRGRTGSSSTAVNPSVRHFKPPVNLHSNCSVTMISNKMYEDFLMKYDDLLSENLQPYGIHHCGNNMEIVAEGYAKVRNVSFFDVGWGSDVKICRQYLPDAFFNLRLSPVKLLSCDEKDVEEDVVRIVGENGGIKNAGICCINIDYGTPDKNVRRIFDTAVSLRNAGSDPET
jgi:hypothetical protein